MEYIFETKYDLKVLTMMARIVRKTVRKKHSRRSHVFGWLAVVFGILMLVPLNGEAVTIDFKKVLTVMAIFVIVCVLLFEDLLNGYLAKKRMLPGTDAAVTRFKDNEFLTELKMGVTDWKYEYIDLLVETKEYFVFVFGNCHAQLYDKKSLVGGTVDEFRNFITEKTGKQILKIK